MRSPEEGVDAVAQWLRDLRVKKLDITTTVLAKRAGLSQGFISSIENGRRRPAPQKAEAIARALGIPAEPLQAWLRVYSPSSPEEYREAFDTVSRHLPPHLRREWEEHRQEFVEDTAMAIESPLSRFRSLRDQVSISHMAAWPHTERTAPTPRELLHDPDTREELMGLLAAELGSGNDHIMEALRHLAAGGDPRITGALLDAVRAGGSRNTEQMVSHIEAIDPDITVRLMERLRDRNPDFFKEIVEHMSADRRPDIVRVPILPEGKDPGPEDTSASRTARWFQLDRTLLPHDHPVAAPFAYEVTEEGARRVGDTLSPGDLVVISRAAWPLIAGEIYALEMRGKIVLSRVAAKSGTLLVLSSDPALEVELLPLGEKGERPEYLRGRVVVAVRRWGAEGR